MRTCAGFAPWSALLLALALPYLSTFVMNKDKPLGKLSVPSPGPRLDCSTEDRLVLFVQVCGVFLLLIISCKCACSMQVSDVHLSKFDANRLARFESFVQKVLPVVRPSVVLMTGSAPTILISHDKISQLSRLWACVSDGVEK